tara:strand:+ start:2543 stop:2737 length:195 start_codon:yes stop_codon:yes gene_type:complete
MTSIHDLTHAINKAAKKVSKTNGWDFRDCVGLVKDLTLGFIPQTFDILTEEEVVNACDDGKCDL